MDRKSIQEEIDCAFHGMQYAVGLCARYERGEEIEGWYAMFQREQVRHDLAKAQLAALPAQEKENAQ